MEIIMGLDNIKHINTPSIITVGVFDGVHIGHRDVLTELIKNGEKKNYKKIILTFKNHPMSIINPRKCPLLLNTYDEKIAILSKFNPDQIVIIDFSREFANYPAEKFIRDFLIRELNMHELVIGYDSSFGKSREGNIKKLMNFSISMNFSINVIPPKYIDNEIISSSLIRNCLLKGDMEKVKELLGYNYTLYGKVIRGEGKGRHYGFPTANLSLSKEKALPIKGIYTIKVFYEGNYFPGIANIGNKPTFGDYDLTLEANIFDFNENLYDKYLQIEFIHMLREEKKFPSREDLYNQIKEDVKIARKKLS